ncbi:[Fe-Fe] hydrogenase large subunit C-terminal domain-containing protein [Cellulosilyticum sp. I15G10I2]|uniref:[Fe-Fe] hydrogenase large subunit C-terminal domain-containing protein n=1 Tax=Cellulosilyticum sp. I15G10I2 TaxID=1892843 RepID=UPI00085C7099|nr:[Fe-Fe] hydrogenase large subunit C-terminal domain-containing protein [Cellulosilyticum sp. I15G10I2]
MWIINFSKANCKNCYACVRSCPVHAISVKSEQAQIMKERCIGCGKCLKVCPKNAKQVKTELQAVKEYIQDNNEIVASIAPSFAALFGEHADKICSALKFLGFTYVEETVVGADFVTEQYEKYIKIHENKCHITSCCPSVNYLVQKHYPELTSHLIPIVSPAVCHSRILKEKYGKQVKVVFIGPCLSKKIEGHEEKTIDAVLTFEELEKWFEEEKIDLNDLDVQDFDERGSRERQYPVVGGVTRNIDRTNVNIEIVQVDGIDECIEVIEAIKDNQFTNTLFEMSCCRHSCIEGPGLPQDRTNVYEKKKRVKVYAEKQSIKQYQTENLSGITYFEDWWRKVNLSQVFPSLHVPLKQPDEEQVRHILRSIGKYTSLDELNCGSCGYHTCREKAIAVYNEMAESNMCLPFMKQRAETLTNVIFDATPNLILIINKELEIVELNPAAEKFFKITKENTFALPIAMFIEEEFFEQVKQTKKSILSQKVNVKQNGSVVIQSIIWIEYHQVMLWIAHDITKDERLEKKLQTMKIDAINMAQQVINKQMTVAQEIASLLGETTAETKVTLTQLKQLILEEEGIKR